MAQMTERQREIINMSPKMFDSYLDELTMEEYQTYLDEVRTVPTDKRGVHGETSVDLINLISRSQSKSTLSLKLIQLAHTFYDQEFFQDLVSAEIPKETIAYQFGTTVENVDCQILLNKRGSQLLEVKQK